MTERGKKYLSDIQIAIDLIELFTKDIDSFEIYVEDLKTQSAVERQLGIIGEAVNKFKQECPDEILENTQQIVGFVLILNNFVKQKLFRISYAASYFLQIRGVAV